MPMWRSHPVLFATLAGAVAGFANALFIEIPGLFGYRASGVLSLLQPASRFSTGADGSNVLQTAFILVIEVAANVLVYAILFMVLGLLFVAIRNLMQRLRRPRER